MKLAALLILALLLAACGGGIAPPSTLPSGYVIQSGRGVAVALPPDWLVIPPTVEQFQQRAAGVAQHNPAMAERLNRMSQSIDEDTLRFAAYAGDGWTSFNISTEAIPAPLGTREQAAATRQGLEALGYQILKTEETRINGQAAERLIAEIAVTLSDGTTLDMSLVQYTLVKGGRAYSLSFGTPSHQLYDLLPTFERIADTFHTSDTP